MVCIGWLHMRFLKCREKTSGARLMLGLTKKNSFNLFKTIKALRIKSKLSNSGIYLNKKRKKYWEKFLVCIKHAPKH
jgi:hypothetical protein